MGSGVDLMPEPSGTAAAGCEAAQERANAPPCLCICAPVWRHE